MQETWRGAMTDSFNKFLEKIITFLPNLLAMITILVVGVFIAWVLKYLLSRFLRAIRFDKAAEHWGLTRVLSKGGAAYSPADLLSRFFYWIIVLIIFLLAINTLQVPATEHLIAQFFNYLPRLFAAIIILVIGYLVSIFLGRATLIAAVNAGMESAMLLGRSVRWFILMLSLAMALYHLGVAEKVVLAAFTIGFGGIVLALAIAFGWGGRDLARDFLERHYKGKTKKEEESDRISHV